MIYSIYGDSEADGEDCNPPFSQGEAYRDLACAAAVQIENEYQEEYQDRPIPGPMMGRRQAWIRYTYCEWGPNKTPLKFSTNAS